MVNIHVWCIYNTGFGGTQVWISFAQFELSVDSPTNIARSRAVYAEANDRMKQLQEEEQRLMLLETWRDFEVRDVTC